MNRTLEQWEKWIGRTTLHQAGAFGDLFADLKSKCQDAAGWHQVAIDQANELRDSRRECEELRELIANFSGGRTPEQVKKYMQEARQ